MSFKKQEKASDKEKAKVATPAPAADVGDEEAPAA